MKKILTQLQNIPYRTSHFMMKKIIKPFKFPIPSVLEGPGMVRRFPEIIKLTGVSSLLVVTSHELLFTGLLDDFLCALESLSIEPIVFDKVIPNPTFQNIEEGLDLYLRENCNGVVAFGGGSAIDCGKMIAARVTNHKSISKMEGFFKLTRKLPPFFAIPTTSGSGSEGSPCALIFDKKNGKQLIVNDPKLVPLATVLDPELTMNLSPELTAATGMSVLTRAVESYLAKYDHTHLREQSLKPTDIIINHLESCYTNGQNQKLRLALFRASLHTGLSFTEISMGYTHAFSHVLGDYYKASNDLISAIVLPYVLEFSRESAMKKLSELSFYSNIGEAMDSDDKLSLLFIEKIRTMNKAMSIPETLSELEAKDIPFLAKRILKEANPAYPVPKIMHYSECVQLLEKLCPR